MSEYADVEVGGFGGGIAGRVFEPVRVGALRLENRLVMAPMTRNRASADGVPGALMAEYYAQRASAGLIIAEATTPNLVGQTYPNIPGIYTKEQVAGWRQVTDAVHEAGGRLYLQLQHGGRIGHPETTGLHPVAPSPIALPGTIHTPAGSRDTVVPREMTTDEIRRTVEDFAAAARNAIEAGFDGVEVHGANGYLIHQFLSNHTNRRTDEYGGAVVNRIRFALEVVRAVAAEIGPERVGLRIAPGVTANAMQEDDVEAVYPALVGELADEGLAYLHVVFADPGSDLFHRIRALWPAALITNPRLPWPGRLPSDGGRPEIEALLAAGADLVALGRAFLANPDLPARLLAGAPLNAIREEHWYGGTEIGYTDYPVLTGDSAPARLEPALA
ncbi:alkene reductase [Bailinhaonella thermotolerans]|uniref:Alkene reductase n=1 Tax=Bailinhaonella thermotolerans TaxID=1070861 RepID=A0A3A4B3Z4_9ACTN|nr:alkene reductase [Bailinhaonella thermotolerans]RJL32090.1 alkene reductase [Bailinhaonella thermotolerans]